MKRQKRWPLIVIVLTLILTVYNILPTVFFYTKPLKSPIKQERAQVIEKAIAKRVNDLETESLDWLKSYCKLLNIKPLNIVFNPSEPQFITLKFNSKEDASKLNRYLDRAGALIPFYPSQLSLLDGSEDSSVVIQRRIPLHFDTQKLEQYFQFAEKKDAQNIPTDLYKALVEDRVLELCVVAGGPSSNALLAERLIQSDDPFQQEDLALTLCQNILSYQKNFSQHPQILNRYFASFSQIEKENPSSFIQNLISHLQGVLTHLRNGKTDETENTSLAWKEKTLVNGLALINQHRSLFSSGPAVLNYTNAAELIRQNKQIQGDIEIFSLQGHSPFIESITIDWASDELTLNLYKDIQALLQDEEKSAFIFSEAATLSRASGETITPYNGNFTIPLASLSDSSSFVAMRLGSIAKAQIEQLEDKVKFSWKPSSIDLQKETFPLFDWQTFTHASKKDQKLCLVFYAPSLAGKIPPQDFHMNSLYVIAKGLGTLIDYHNANPHSEEAKTFLEDFKKLQTLLMKNGFTAYPGKLYTSNTEFASDYIFEARDYYQWVLGATRENFKLVGTKRYAILEFSNVEQRILTENKIDNAIHEDLLKSRDDYQAARLQIRGLHTTDVPKPTRSPLLSNLSLSWVKYFRGDDRKILKWGLDLSGGKTVQLELRDKNNKLVTNPESLKQGINELYSRVNKMGVSEVSIRQEGSTITLDFPGSQSLSAAELIKASSMFFHIVNEKFSSGNKELAQTLDRFLQNIWDEAVISNKTSPEQINLIAYKHLYGNPSEETPIPPSESAKILQTAGLKIAHPYQDLQSSLLDDTLSKIAIFKGSDPTDWYGQTHPLLIVFKNYVIEGSDLEQIQASYDPSKGNYLNFGIKGAYTTKEGIKVNPSEDLHKWTSVFAKEKIQGTSYEVYSKGRGWRMAVILNGAVISAPTLDSPLSNHASITGSFTQREIVQLETDLKAGSLTYSPYIISEKNVSPELGQKERFQGILATGIALVLVMIVMISYYRFAGLVASCAVLINLLILWAALVNVGATLTLASIAGLILTVGMAVDANVLVFERMKEEYQHSSRLIQAVHAGYKKAFSAIIDSNITTIIAALILLNFDSGPVKGFALTLIIGIFSSLFTALFLTRHFFFEWVKNPKHTQLNMSSWIKSSHFPFLKYAKPTLLISFLVILMGILACYKSKNTLLGMDFSGGFSLTVEMPFDPKENDYTSRLEKALFQAGVSKAEIQVRQLSPSNYLKVFLSKSLEIKGGPFYGLAQGIEKTAALYPYQLDPRLNWIVEALSKGGIHLSSQVLENLDKNWTIVSGQMSDTMRNEALIGLAIALLCILIYITIRFEFHYALSATLCLAHDLVFTIATLGLLHRMGVPIQIDINTIAALMTILGYSLNDTIIIFDRIREDLSLYPKMPLKEVIEQALNATLSRTLMTSGTTLIVLLPMIALGGSTIFGFALVMSIGVFFGTLSSLFVAAPLMQVLANKKRKNGLDIHIPVP